MGSGLGLPVRARSLPHIRRSDQLCELELSRQFTLIFFLISLIFFARTQVLAPVDSEE